MDLEYHANEFVAVQGEGCTQQLPFWLGKIKKVNKTLDGVVTSLIVHWFEVYNGKGAFHGIYAPSYLHKTKKPWAEVVLVDTVLTHFESLTVKDSKWVWSPAYEESVLS